MITSLDEKKIEQICQMILEVSSGNFSYRIERSGRADPLEKVVVLLNMMAEEIRESFHHFALVNPHESYQQLSQVAFILDENFRIRNFNEAAYKLIGADPAKLYGQEFHEFLTEESRCQWQLQIREIKKDPDRRFYHTLRLFFVSQNSLTVPSQCSISSLALKKDETRLYFVTALHTVVQSKEKEAKIQQALELGKRKSSKKNSPQQTLLYREADKKKIQQVYDYILNHLEEPLPTLKKLAHQHGTNEFKLKIGFKQLYNTSVFKFQKEQRLKRAHSFIVNSELSLPKIADICGFSSLSHFSKVFKKQYGYNPSELQRKRNLGNL